MKKEKIISVFLFGTFMFVVDMCLSRIYGFYSDYMMLLSAICVAVYWSLIYVILSKCMEYIEHKWAKGAIAILMLATFVAGTYLFNFLAGDVMYGTLKFKSYAVNTVAFCYILYKSIK